MPLSCDCDCDGDWFYMGPSDYSVLNTKRSRKCCSCGAKIQPGDTVNRYQRFRGPNNDIEERIYGDEVPMSDKYHCEECADLYWNLDALGYCVLLDDNMRSLIKEYAEMHKH